MPTPNPTPSPSPGPKPKPYVNPRGPKADQQRWIAMGNWATANPKKSGYVPPTKPNTTTTTPSKTSLVKSASISDYASTYDSQRKFSTEEYLTFAALTSIDILQVTRNYDISSSSTSLNKNVVDIVNVVNSFSPTEIIKLQQTDKNYFNQFSSNLEGHSFSLNNSTGIATISIPQASTRANYKVQVQTLTPTVIKNGTIY